MRKLRHQLVNAARVEMLPALLIPFMQKFTSEQGHAIFQKGDNANKVYLILRGQVLLQDSKQPITEGQLFGLLGVFRANCAVPTQHCV